MPFILAYYTTARQDDCTNGTLRATKKSRRVALPICRPPSGLEWSLNLPTPCPSPILIFLSCTSVNLVMSLPGSALGEGWGGERAARTRWKAAWCCVEAANEEPRPVGRSTRMLLVVEWISLSATTGAKSSATLVTWTKPILLLPVGTLLHLASATTSVIGLSDEITTSPQYYSVCINTACPYHRSGGIEIDDVTATSTAQRSTMASVSRETS